MTSISPKIFFLGVLLGFLACCIGGYSTTLSNQYGEHSRFGQLLSPDALFAPTFCQLRAIAKGRATPEKILIIVGGNSILNGTGQEESRIWTKELQNQLGNEYVVLNYGLRGGSTFDGGYLVAESLANEYKKLIVVTNCLPAVCRNGTFAQHDYYYFDGLYKGLLKHCPSREEEMKHRMKSIEEDRTKWEELSLRKRIDSVSYFDDLWTTLAYRKFFTVWNFLALDNFSAPRRKFLDNEGITPALDERIKQWSTDDSNSRISFQRVVKSDSSGKVIKIDEAWNQFDREIRNVTPVSMRKQTLVLHIPINPWFKAKLSGADQQCYDYAFHESVKHWKEASYQALYVGQNFEPNDYRDRVHLCPTGGDKLASITAAKVREIAKELRYIQ